MLVAFAFHEGQKFYWDAQVEELCARNGGVKVFERVRLAPRDYALLKNRFNKLSIPHVSRAAGDPIVHFATRTFIRQGSPEVWKNELVVFRRADNKVLGKRVSYGRVGGDLWLLQPSHFTCPEISEDLFAAVVQAAGK